MGWRSKVGVEVDGWSKVGVEADGWGGGIRLGWRSKVGGEVDGWLEQGKLGECLARDQLLPLLGGDEASAGADSQSGMWPLFEEAPIQFPPTYKFDKNSETYDSSMFAPR